MKPTELAHFRRTLETRQGELAAVLCNREVVAIDSSADMFEVQHASARDMAMGNLHRDSLRLREVRDALRRADLGTFGICLDCHEEIGMKRLAALPWTTSCIGCKAAADRCLDVDQEPDEELALPPRLTVVGARDL